ncbi:hypothetical protein IG631_19534 [Alternaria alternata]|nr:hypothetical protein IG631_19534 [Alternaria alternata]
MSGQVIPSANDRADALKSIGVIPRTPSPSQQSEDEDEDKDPEDMTEEEMRAELRSDHTLMTDRSQEKRQDAIRIKREREEESQAGDTILVDDDEVQWTLTQPKQR